AAQPLALASGTSRLKYAGSTGFAHRYVAWCDPRRGERAEVGHVDLAYLGRWGHAVTRENGADEELVARLERIASDARSWMRHGVYPLDLVLAGAARPTRFHGFFTGETYTMPAPVDVEIVSTLLA